MCRGQPPVGRGDDRATASQGPVSRPTLPGSGCAPASDTGSAGRRFPYKARLLVQKQNSSQRTGRTPVPTDGPMIAIRVYHPGRWRLRFDWSHSTIGGGRSSMPSKRRRMRGQPSFRKTGAACTTSMARTRQETRWTASIPTGKNTSFGRAQHWCRPPFHAKHRFSSKAIPSRYSRNPTASFARAHSMMFSEPSMIVPLPSTSVGTL